jgi:hypothetical protein
MANACDSLSQANCTRELGKGAFSTTRLRKMTSVESESRLNAAVGPNMGAVGANDTCRTSWRTSVPQES